MMLMMMMLRLEHKARRRACDVVSMYGLAHLAPCHLLQLCNCTLHLHTPATSYNCVVVQYIHYCIVNLLHTYHLLQLPKMSKTFLRKAII